MLCAGQDKTTYFPYFQLDKLNLMWLTSYLYKKMIYFINALVAILSPIHVLSIIDLFMFYLSNSSAVFVLASYSNMGVYTMAIAKMDFIPYFELTKSLSKPTPWGCFIYYHFAKQTKGIMICHDRLIKFKANRYHSKSGEIHLGLGVT